MSSHRRAGSSAVDRSTPRRLWEAGLAGNARRVAEALRAAGPCTRARLVAATGLSRPTVSASLSELDASGLISEESGRPVRPGGGRPAGSIRLSRRAGLAAGIELGRRHIRLAMADLGHDVLAEREVRLDAECDDRPDEALAGCTRLLFGTLAEIGAGPDAVVGVGFGVPAPITHDGRIGSPGLLPAWAGLRPAQALSDRLSMPVLLDNDANLGALGEHLWGAGRDCDHLVYVKVATGIGAGLVLDGRLFRGVAGTAGELGHVTLDARGEVCPCGNRGCLELTAGGRALLTHARAVQPDIADLADLVRRALDGDPGCRRLLADAGTELGIAMGGLVNLVNPGRILLGGDLGGAVELLIEPLRRGLAGTAMPAAVDAVEVTGAQLAARASALGGVALVLRATGTNPPGAATG